MLENSAIHRELSCGDVYPDEIPLVKFKTSRGLSDASLEDIR